MGLLSRASTNPSSNTQADESKDDADADKAPLDDDGSFDAEILMEEEIPAEAGEEAQAESASQKTKFPLDEMGKALSERIKRLPHNSSTPYTALSLLKAYGAFQSGVCLTLKDGVYTSYTSVGLGVDKISIPRGKIWSEEKSQLRYYKHDAGESLGIHASHEKPGYWIFPLDSDENHSEAWEDIVILGVPDHAGVNSTFNPETISAIIPEIIDKLVLRINHSFYHPAGNLNSSDHGGQVEQATAEKGSVEQGSTEQGSMEKSSMEPGSMEQGSMEHGSMEHGSTESGQNELESLKEKIADYHRIHNDFGCILLDVPEPAEKAGFCKEVSKMLSMTGTVFPLSNGRSMILLPKKLDRELIAHRLSASLKSKILESFETDNSENVFSKIESLL